MAATTETATTTTPAPVATPAATPAPKKAPAGKKPQGKGPKGKPPAAGKKGGGKKKEAEAPNPNGNRGKPTAAPVEVAKRSKLAGVVVTSKPTAGVQTRASFAGHSITSVLRTLGYHGHTVAQNTAVVAALGIPLRPNCIKAQTGSGRSAKNAGLPLNQKGPNQWRYGPPALLTAEELKKLQGLAKNA